MARRRLTIWWARVRVWLHRQQGQDLSEYALIIALIVIVGIAAYTTMGTELAGLWGRILERISSALAGV